MNAEGLLRHKRAQNGHKSIFFFLYFIFTYFPFLQVFQNIFAKLGVRLNGFHELDDRLPRRLFGDVVLKRGLGFVVVPVGLEEPEETPEELAAESVEMEPFDDRG